MTRPPHVVLRAPNGVGIRVPLQWTDADARDDLNRIRIRFTTDSLLELVRLVESLGGYRKHDLPSEEADQAFGLSQEETHEAKHALDPGVCKERD
jgi:hypothetical protein